eukprot:CAMPEP_0117441236 /NCGR_PEP_ID=MMETSP0759-20121206/3532_1 /TAXON_ID=63605 /ORGANISM="Percolomonas cosmopolitus, Strain WS" /LENGTH=65 /DNA_ID=CAMNT_0005233087 /DNA_START=55 /DNA_END=248 /DNA_ORIENTATION=+
MALQFPIQDAVTLDALLTHYSTTVMHGGYNNIKDNLRDTVFAGIPNVAALKNNTEDQLRDKIDRV